MYRQFLYLDSEDVLNAMSCFDGDFAERTIKTIRNREFGGRIAVGPIEFGGKNNRTIEEEVRRKSTSHSAISALLKVLEKDISRVDKDKTTFEENGLIQFDGDIEAWPSEQSPDRVEQSTWSVLRSRFWPTEDDRQRDRQATLGLPRSATFKVVISPTERWAVMLLRAAFFQMSTLHGGLRREVTVIGQVESWSDKPKDNAGPRPVPLSRRSEALAVVHETNWSRSTDGWTPELVPSTQIDASSSPQTLRRLSVDSVVIDHPWVLVRPLCIFK